MYSPSRQKMPKEELRQQIKEQKKLQLSTLLVNKFRNKFNVIGHKEGNIDKMIRDEIMIMFEEGTTSEAALNKLDRKLEYMIKKARNGEIETPKAYGNAQQDDARSIGAQSRTSGGMMAAANRSARVSQSNDFGARKSNGVALNIVKPGTIDKKRDTFKGGLIVFEDPAEALNMSEDKWNSVVLKNLVDFEAEKQKKKDDKYNKAKTIQELQRKQMEEKRNRHTDIAKQEKEFFNSMGVRSSDIYYVNQDKKTAQMAALKGGATVMAQDLRVQYGNKLNLKQEAMQQQAIDRRAAQQALIDEDNLAKQKKQQKKIELQQVVQKDIENKRQFANRHSQMNVRSGGDFGEENVLSYCFTKKEHPSIKKRAKNEYLVGLINSQFLSTDKLAVHEAKTLQRDIEEINRKNDTEIEKRKKERKNKEMQAKLFQDKQIAEKNQIKMKSAQEKANDQQRLLEDVEKYKKLEQDKKTEKLNKQKNHLGDVMMQMNVEKKMFAKTGVAIIKNMGTPVQTQ